MNAPTLERSWDAAGTPPAGSSISLHDSLVNTRTPGGFLLPFPVVWSLRIGFEVGAQLVCARDYEGLTWRGNHLIADVMLGAAQAIVRRDALGTGDDGRAVSAKALGCLIAHLWTGRAVETTNEIGLLRAGVPEHHLRTVRWALDSIESDVTLVEICAALRRDVPRRASYFREVHRRHQGAKAKETQISKSLYTATVESPQSARAWIEVAVSWSRARVESAAAFAWAEAICASRGDRTIVLAVCGWLRLRDARCLARFFDDHGHACLAAWLRDSASVA